MAQHLFPYEKYIMKTAWFSFVCLAQRSRDCLCNYWHFSLLHEIIHDCIHCTDMTSCSALWSLSEEVEYGCHSKNIGCRHTSISGILTCFSPTKIAGRNHKYTHTCTYRMRARNEKQNFKENLHNSSFPPLLSRNTLTTTVSPDGPLFFFSVTA